MELAGPVGKGVAGGGGSLAPSIALHPLPYLDKLARG